MMNQGRFARSISSDSSQKWTRPRQSTRNPVSMGGIVPGVGSALVIMVGAPGSGKSYLARTLSEALGAVLIQTDAVRKELFPDPRYTPGEASTVYAECHRRIAAALGRGACVIFDGT